MDEKTYPSKSVIRLLGQVVPVKLNSDIKTNDSIYKKYKVDVIPTIIVMDANGKVIGRFVGFKPPQEFISSIKPWISKKH